MKNLIKTTCIAAVAATAALTTACSPKVVTPQATVVQLNLALIEDPQTDRYLAQDYGIRLNVKDGRSDKRILNRYDASAVTLPRATVNPELLDFVSESTRQYMRTMGFNLDADIATDYLMDVQIIEYNVGYLSGLGWSGTVRMTVKVFDSQHQLVYPSVTVSGRANMGGASTSFYTASQALNKAYANALKDIDWDRIAFFLKKASSPALEKNKQVTGAGNTALESTVIRWFIDSAPKGADVSTRIVSSTPDVKNTNSNYVGSTPYETTETFDVRGLTFNNSGDVQIEVTCEKAGYITQKKRFNLRQAIEQKEISTKFNLVKED